MAKKRGVGSLAYNYYLIINVLSVQNFILYLRKHPRNVLFLFSNVTYLMYNGLSPITLRSYIYLQLQK